MIARIKKEAEVLGRERGKEREKGKERERHQGFQPQISFSLYFNFIARIGKYVHSYFLYLNRNKPQPLP